MASPRNRGKLAYKILFWFLLISLTPMIFVGWHLVGITQQSLRKETLAMQESLAVGFSDTTYKYVTTFRNVLTETAGLEDFVSMNPIKQQQSLNRILQIHLAVLELSVLNASGVEVLRVGRFLGPNPEMRDFSHEDLFQTAIGPKGQYIGRLERFQGAFAHQPLLFRLRGFLNRCRRRSGCCFKPGNHRQCRCG